MTSPKLYNKVAAVLLLLIVTISVVGRITTAQDEMNVLCNGARYQLGDRRRACVYHLLTLMYQFSSSVVPGEWYESYSCDDGRYTLYGYRWADEGNAAALECLRKARDILRTGTCVGRTGGRAAGEGCYMRHEAYPFTEG